MHREIFFLKPFFRGKGFGANCQNSSRAKMPWQLCRKGKEGKGGEGDDLQSEYLKNKEEEE